MRVLCEAPPGSAARLQRGRKCLERWPVLSALPGRRGDVLRIVKPGSTHPARPVSPTATTLLSAFRGLFLLFVCLLSFLHSTDE